MLQQFADQVMRLITPPHETAKAPDDCESGMAFGPGGARRYYLYRPPGLQPGERGLPLMVMLHGCGQTARDFAASTRMNALAARKRFFVLYLEQDRLANPKGCWNWYERQSGRAHAEAATLMAAIEQVCLHDPVDRSRIALAGLSAGASMAALMATRYPRRFSAVAMHSGVAPGAAYSPLTAFTAMRGAQDRPAMLTAVGKMVSAAASLGTLPPLLVLHGDADEVVVPGNADASASVWALATGAEAGPERRRHRGRRHATRTTLFTSGGRTCVTLCKVEGLGHDWSGGAPGMPFSDPHGPDATRLVWAFANAQSAPLEAEAQAA